MTAATATRPPAPVAPQRPASPGVTARRVVAAEWVKFRSLRSTIWTLATTVVLWVGVSVLVAWGITSEGGMPGGGEVLPFVLTAGYNIAWLPVAVLGVLTITGEYTTGMIRSTLAAVPRRLPALWAKAAVVAVVVAVVTVASVGLSWVATLPFHDELGPALDGGDPSTLRLLLGAPLYTTTIALLALAIGAVIRHSAGAMATVFGLMLVVETVFALVPLTFFERVSPFLPSTAGSRLLLPDEAFGMLQAPGGGVELGPWQGYAVLVAWVVVLMGIAAVLLRRRDA